MNVFAKICRKIWRLGRRIARITSQEARIELPPFKGVKLKTEGIAFCVTEDFAATDSLIRLLAGSVDHGPVQATTTRISTIYGAQANNPSRPEASSAAFDATVPAGSSAAPPKPRIVLGRQSLTSRNRIQNEASAPLKSGGYGPRKCATGHCPGM